MTNVSDVLTNEVDAVMFDLDDTLLDHGAAATRGAQELARVIGHTNDIEGFVMSWKAHSADAYPRYLKGELTYEDMRYERMRKTVDPGLRREEALRLFEIYASAYQAAWMPFDDVAPCLQAFSRLKLGVITNGQSQEQRSKLRAIGVESRLNHITTSEEFGRPKPEAAIYLHACDRLQVRPDRTLYVGDNHKVDFLGARCAGLRSLWLNRKAAGAAQRNEGEIGSLSELWKSA